ncbi:MAG: phosphoribosylglycinamide formyltransferase [Candidatus Omnitrophota bacterium]
MMTFACLVSGRGTNLQTILNVIKKGKLKTRCAVVLSDNEKALALKRAVKAGVKAVYINPKDFRTRALFDRAILDYLKAERVDFVVLAGFMRVLSPAFVRAYRNKILNIHPALLPNFRGAHAIRDAFKSGVDTTGVTVHFVDEKVDHGPIILQEKVKISPKDTLASLEAKIHKVEHKLYPKAIDLFVKKKLKIAGRKVRIKK